MGRSIAMVLIVVDVVAVLALYTFRPTYADTTTFVGLLVPALLAAAYLLTVRPWGNYD